MRNSQPTSERMQRNQSERLHERALLPNQVQPDYQQLNN